MPDFVRYLHFMILHRLFCLVFDVMFVSMIDVTGGWLRPPDESGGYRMTDGIACFSQYPNKPYPTPNTPKPYPTPSRRPKLPLSRSLDLPLSTTAGVALISLFRIIKELQGCFYLKNVYPFQILADPVCTCSIFGVQFFCR